MKNKSKPVKNENKPAKAQIIKKYLKRYFIDAMSSMALGLFASLIIGLILKQLFVLTDQGFLSDIKEVVKSVIPIEGMRQYIETATSATSPVIGAAIGISVAAGLKSKPLALYSAAVAGSIGYSVRAAGVLIIGSESMETIVSAGPVGAFVAGIVAAEVGNWIYGKTKFDILAVPASAILSSAFVSVLVGPVIAGFMTGLGQLIVNATELLPLPLGILVSAIMGLALTAPISSAALSIMLGLSGLAAGAATAGCSAHMVGFAVAGFRENKFSGLISQGLGTSMLQIGNIMKHPGILIPAVTASIITGALSTTVFKMRNIAIGAGMGTSGLVGQITTWQVMSTGSDAVPKPTLLLYMFLLYFLIPGVVALTTSEILRKTGFIKFGDMKIDS